MRISGWRWLALLPFLGTVAALVLNVTVFPFDEETSTEFVAGLVAFLSALSFASIGGYLAFRLPRNSVGWLMSVYGFVFAGILSSESVAATSSMVSIREWMAWFSSWAWALTGAIVTILLPLLFPDGRLPNHRWKWVLWTLGGALVLLFVANGFSPDSTAPVRNPLGVPAWREPLDFIGLIAFAVYAGCIGAGVAAVVFRYRRSDGVARRQMQVFAASAVTIAVGALIGYSAYELGLVTVAQLVLASVSLFVPLAIGMAVLRYRLYDFGRIFKRTVTYSIVAAVLVGAYALAVVSFQALLGSEDSLSVAGSTLAAAALFNPVRRRVHTFVESHFDRARYNASVVVDEFSTRMLQEVDLDQLNADLAGVVDRTLRPVGLSLWLRAG
jgi:hypothetical protein